MHLVDRIQEPNHTPYLFEGNSQTKLTSAGSPSPWMPWPASCLVGSQHRQRHNTAVDQLQGRKKRSSEPKQSTTEHKFLLQLPQCFQNLSLCLPEFCWANPYIGSTGWWHSLPAVGGATHCKEWNINGTCISAHWTDTTCNNEKHLKRSSSHTTCCTTHHSWSIK